MVPNIIQLFILLLFQFLLQFTDDLFLIQFSQFPFLFLLSQFIFQNWYPIIVRILNSWQHNSSLFIFDFSFFHELFPLFNHLSLLQFEYDSMTKPSSLLIITSSEDSFSFHLKSSHCWPTSHVLLLSWSSYFQPAEFWVS